MIDKPDVLDSRILHRGWAQFRVDKLYVPGHGEMDYDVVTPGDGAAMLAFLDDKTLLLESQYRHPLQQEVLELIQGGMSKGETPEEAAERELLEETGMKAKLEYMGFMHPLPALLDMRVHIFKATELVKVEEPVVDALEKHRLLTIPYEQVKEEIMSGKHHDSALVWAVLSHYARK